MSYLRAEEVLPQSLIEAIQQYVSGTSIYIPSPEKRAWGSQTDTKQALRDRNLGIYRRYQSGASIQELAESYHICAKSIQRIIRELRTHEQAD